MFTFNTVMQSRIGLCLHAVRSVVLTIVSFMVTMLREAFAMPWKPACQKITRLPRLEWQIITICPICMVSLGNFDTTNSQK